MKQYIEIGWNCFLLKLLKKKKKKEEENSPKMFNYYLYSMLGNKIVYFLIYAVQMGSRAQECVNFVYYCKREITKYMSMMTILFINACISDAIRLQINIDNIHTR